MKIKQLAYAIGLIGFAGIAIAHADDQDQQPAKAEKIEVTGSSIKRITKEGALPVTTLSRDDIAKTGAASTADLLNALPAISSAGGVAQSAVAGLATYGESSISLRGLGSNRTLVLVNGRRMATFAGSGADVDVSSIPLAAIDHLEILKDGASGLYGSDAVAGVVNFILSKDYQGFEATVTSGVPTHGGGGGEQTKANFVAGWGSLDKDHFNIMASGDIEHDSALFGYQRSFANSGNVSPWTVSGATGSGNIEGAWIPGQSYSANQQSTTNPYGITSSFYGNPYANNCAALGHGMFASHGHCSFDSAPAVGLIPDDQKADFLLNLHAQVTPNDQIYAEAMIGRNTVNEAYQPSPFKTGFLNTDTAFTGSGVDPAFLISPNNPNYPTAWLQANQPGLLGKTLAISERGYMFGPRAEKDTTTNTRFVAGIKGSTANNWDYDVALSQAESKTYQSLVSGYVQELQAAQLINGSNWNPWAPNGAQAPALQQQLLATNYTGEGLDADFKTTGFDAKIFGVLAALPNGDLGLATGIGGRRDDYNVQVPAVLSAGNISGFGGGIPQVNQSRTIKDAWLDLDAPLLKNLDVELQLRDDHYSDVGNTTNGKLQARWEVTKDYLVRGSLGTGFRAPTLVELYKPDTIGTSEQFTDPRAAFVNNGPQQVNAVTGGNANLKPEKSDQWSIGFVAQPIKQVSASVDFWNIKIKRAIIAPTALEYISAETSPTTGLPNGNSVFYPGDATFNPNGSLQQIDETSRNSSQILTNGVDLDLRWNDRFSFGRLGAALNGTYTNKFDLTRADGYVEHSVGAITYKDQFGNVNALDAAATGVILRWKHQLTLTWDNASWGVALIQNYASGYHDAPSQIDGVTPHDVSSLTTYDMQTRFKGFRNLTLTLGAKNLLDTKPPFYIGNGNTFVSGYDPTQYDPRGRFVYGTVNYKFF